MELSYILVITAPDLAIDQTGPHLQVVHRFDHEPKAGMGL